MFPAHWENALINNGRLSVDTIRSIQKWHLEGRDVPDGPDVSQERGEEQVRFSKVERVTRCLQSAYPPYVEANLHQQRGSKRAEVHSLEKRYVDR